MSLANGDYHFGPFVLDCDQLVLSRDGYELPVTPKALTLLRVLVENRGRIVGKRELMERVWADSFVEEGNLAYTIRLLRGVLGDDAANPRFIQTLPRRGYRFIADLLPDLPTTTPTNKPIAFPTERRLLDNRGLIAREREIFEVTRLLSCDDVRIVTLTGPGGTGKTRLAREIESSTRDQSPDGVFFVELASVSDPALVLNAIAYSLGVTEKGATQLLDKISNYFLQRDALLILDNFEQIVTAGVQIARLVQAVPRLKILVTSREPLKLSIETEYRVPPLAVPSLAASGSIAEVMRYGAVQLFVKRASSARHDLELKDDDASDISAICHKLDGLPLALELAASRAKVLSVREILSKLANRLDILTGGMKDLPDRQQTMRATIEWSYGLLTDIEKEVFDDLAVFENGFTFDAAENVLGQGNALYTGSQILDSITSLTEKGLLDSDRIVKSELRFRMPVIVRDFASERFASSDHAESILRMHTEYFLELAERAAPKMRTHQGSKWNITLEADHDNLRAALKRSVDVEPLLAARIAVALEMLWTVHGHFRESQLWIEKILDRGIELPRKLRWRLMTRLGVMRQFCGEFEKAHALYLACMEESRKAGDMEQMSRSLRGLAAIEYMHGRLDSAIKRANEALEVAASIGDEFGVAASRSRLGDIALTKGDLDEARRRAGEALKTYRKLGYIYGMASKLYTTAMAELLAGERESAKAHFAEALQHSMAIGDKQVIHSAFDGFAALLAGSGDRWNGARLAGFSKGLSEDIDYILEPAEKKFRDLYMEGFRDSMSERELAAAEAEGRRMTIDSAAEFVLRWAGLPQVNVPVADSSGQRRQR